ncbi:hypothetical protein P171DRAFT_267775 [Karstenula rhodostoma CBS 690.94]|uniref:Uncharacterized protein n=1 Tax=Karstenula rhodostoma CBS 690.94 TaxID=1392251 RepID=A0A9P4PLX7_9PLEO|nr:hypothetical protein P171DRAFT_267775 [Karstenula rhodostoma CBS 690.94]
MTASVAGSEKTGGRAKSSREAAIAAGWWRSRTVEIKDGASEGCKILSRSVWPGVNLGQSWRRRLYSWVRWVGQESTCVSLGWRADLGRR